VERTKEEKERKPVEQVQMGCLTQTRSVGRIRGSPVVAGTSVVVADAVAAAGGTNSVAVAVVVVADAAIPLAVGQAGAVPVAVPVTLAAAATTQLVAEPIAPEWPLVEPVVAKG